MDQGERLDTTDRWFAENLRLAREKAGLSQAAVAERMREKGFPQFQQQTVGQIEAGKRAVRVGEAFLLAAITGKGIGELARPPDAIRDAMRLRTGTDRLRHLHDQVREVTQEKAWARQMLESAIASARASEKAEGLAMEIRHAEQALAETASFRDEPLVTQERESQPH